MYGKYLVAYHCFTQAASISNNACLRFAERQGTPIFHSSVFTFPACRSDGTQAKMKTQTRFYSCTFMGVSQLAIFTQRYFLYFSLS